MEEDEDEDGSAASLNLIGLDAPLAQEEPQEQREDLPMSNSARRGILRQHVPNRLAGAEPRAVRFADATQFTTTYTNAACTPRHPSTYVDTEDVEMVAVKQEDDEYVSSAGPSNSSTTPVSSTFSSTVKVKPQRQCSVTADTLESETRSSPTPSQQPQTAAPERAAVVEIPSIVVTAAPEQEETTILEREAATRPDAPLTLQQLLSVARRYCLESLSLVQVPSHELLHLRAVAHFLLQSSGSKQFTRLVQKWEKEALRRLRDILKHLLELTAIVKLKPSEVPDEMWNKTKARSEGRLKAVIKLVDRPCCASSALMRRDRRSDSVLAVKRGGDDQAVPVL
ncbi:uncharacterized protein SPSC_04125 [Sporisorium scitamineum]|uniref:Uncharacterized protein n=1 Tax=Sporisorium scitamineum TaxID=49012 RepID=A0A127Z383_9BASI|nr:uncharacterized protein SPSC_04125 [Sporisorium scitamineum]